MNKIQVEKNTNLLKSKAVALGFQYCGVSKAEFLAEEAPRLERWLQRNSHGTMEYMENYFDKRLDPTKLVEGAKSVVSLLYNYFPADTQNNASYKISKYAYGEDYHSVIKEKLNELMLYLSQEIGEINGRVFVDSAPVLEKAWARKSGVGWIGKNANIINKNAGSFYFLAEVILDLDLTADGPVKDYCGTCTRCLDACPTQAIVEPYVVDGSKCISYLTIELKAAIPDAFANKMDNWVFGCDICQDVCPWNRFSKPHQTVPFKISQELQDLDNAGFEEMTLEAFGRIFKRSAVKRTKFEGIQRNIRFVKRKG